MRQLEAVVTSLLLISLSSLNALVPAPENVTVRCENWRTTVQWDYSDQQPNTTFIVKLDDSELAKVQGTEEREFDLSRFIWTNEDQYMKFHHVIVTALQGSSHSADGRSNSFSFSPLISADTKCMLDLPPVTMTVEESEATVTVENPFYRYNELEQANKLGSAIFRFNVSQNNSSDAKTPKCPRDTLAHCGTYDKKCRYSFKIPKDTRPCVTLRGWIVKQNWFDCVEFKQSDSVCPTDPEPTPEPTPEPSPEPSPEHWLIVALMLTIVFFVITGLTVAICKLRAWTLKTPPLPDHLVPNPQSHLKPRSFSEPVPVFSPIQILGSRAPLFDPEEDCPTTDAPDKSEAVALMLPEPHDDKYTDSLDTETLSLHSSSSLMSLEWSLYEARPHFVNMDLEDEDGDGDIVIAYTAS